MTRVSDTPFTIDEIHRFGGYYSVNDKVMISHFLSQNKWISPSPPNPSFFTFDCVAARPVAAQWFRYAIDTVLDSSLFSFVLGYMKRQARQRVGGFYV